MAIDHGLGGKDNTKSKDKRAKRALRNKKVALKAITGGKKREVIFDAAAREDFLTGFRKRKQERRKYGIAMDMLKKGKAHRENVRNQRSALKISQGTELSVKNGLNVSGESEEDADQEKDSSSSFGKIASADAKVDVFADSSTVSMFGSAVSVVIDDNTDCFGPDDHKEDNNLDSDENEFREDLSKRRRKPEKTRFEKAMQKAKVVMQQPKKKKHGKDDGVDSRDTKKGKYGNRRNAQKTKKQEASTKLFHKVVTKSKLSGSGRR